MAPADDDRTPQQSDCPHCAYPKRTRRKEQPMTRYALAALAAFAVFAALYLAATAGAR